MTTRDRRTRGFTLIELLITAVVIGSAFIAATWSMSATARTKAMYEGMQSPAAFLCREMHELADGLPRTPSGVTGVTSAADVVALDSLVGASFSPPILADGTPVLEFADWRQDVDLLVFEMDDLLTPTADAPEDGLPADGSKLYRLDVRVWHDEELVDSFQWWITP